MPVQYSKSGKVEHINPDGMSKNPAFTNVIVVSGNTKTVYVGGQNALDAAGNVVGKGDLGTQVEQIFKNIEIALAAGGATLEQVVKWSIYVVQGQSLQVGFGAFQKAWGRRPNPPTITVLFVAGLANPDFLAEVEAIAVVPE